MENLKAILQTRLKKIEEIQEKDKEFEENTQKIQKKRKKNEFYENCRQISQYTKLPIGVVMGFSKKFGRAKVDGLKGFLADYPNLDPNRAVGLAYLYLNDFKKTEQKPKKKPKFTPVYEEAA